MRGGARRGTAPPASPRTSPPGTPLHGNDSLGATEEEEEEGEEEEEEEEEEEAARQLTDMARRTANYMSTHTHSCHAVGWYGPTRCQRRVNPQVLLTAS